MIASRLGTRAQKLSGPVTYLPRAIWAGRTASPSSTPAYSAARASCRSAKVSRYRSGRSRDWVKTKNPACAAVKREAEEAVAR